MPLAIFSSPIALSGNKVKQVFTEMTHGRQASGPIRVYLNDAIIIITRAELQSEKNHLAREMRTPSTQLICTILTMTDYEMPSTYKLEAESLKLISCGIGSKTAKTPKLRMP